MSSKTILILHRIPFANIQYDQVIDHQQYQVIYVGSEMALMDIPESLECQKWSVNLDDNWIDIITRRVLNAGWQIERILGMSEYQLESAALLRERLQVPGTTTAQVQLSRDKVLMKKAVADAGLRVPFFCSLPELLQQHKPELDNHRVVLKPKKGASSEDIQVFESVSALVNCVVEKRTHIAALDQHQKTSDFEVEEFIHGDIWHVDGFVQQGKVQQAVASQYVGNCLAFAQGQAFGSVQMPMSNRLAHFTQAIITAVDIVDGSFHLEVFKQGDDWIFLEIGHRCGGADVVQSYLMKTGVNLYHAHIRTQLGLTDDIPLSEKQDCFGWFVFPGHHLAAQYAQIELLNDIQRHPYLVRWHQLPSHKKLTKQITYQKSQVPVAGLFCSPSSAKGIEFLHTLFASVMVQGVTHVERSESLVDEAI